MLLILLAIFTAIILLIALIETTLGLRSIVSLMNIEPPKGIKLPKVSIIVTARNEADSIRSVLIKLCQQDYENFEIICVNDRSDDDTGNIIDSISEQNSIIKPIHIKDLPPNWLGKNYASFCAAKQATGEWLLFMDADVHFDVETLKRASYYATNKQLDHLTIFPYYQCRGFWHNVVHLSHKGFGHVVPLKPWLAKSKRSKKSFNLGVFNFVKKDVYYACGGHQKLALECVEDLNFGKLVKAKGFSQDVLNAQDFISITCNESLLDMFNCCKKNYFAYFKFKIPPVIFGTIMWCIFYIWPFFAAFLTSGLCQVINLINIVFILALYWVVASFFRVPKKIVLFCPAGLIIFLYPLYLSVAHFLLNKGIYWRGTFYDAKTLKSYYQDNS